MEHYCKRCEATRGFRLIEEGPLEHTYECYSCGLRWKRKTGTGWAMAAAGPVISAVGWIFGVPHPPHHDGGGYS